MNDLTVAIGPDYAAFSCETLPISTHYRRNILRTRLRRVPNLAILEFRYRRARLAHFPLRRAVATETRRREHVAALTAAAA